MAEPKNQSDEERPTDPAVWCLAFTREDFREVVAAVAPEKDGSAEEGGRPAAVGV